MVVKLYFEQPEGIIQKYPDDGKFFNLTYSIHDDKVDNYF